MATHSSVLAWRIPGTGEPGGLPSMGSHRVPRDWSDLAAAAVLITLLVVHLWTRIPSTLFAHFLSKTCLNSKYSPNTSHCPVPGETLNSNKILSEGDQQSLDFSSGSDD